MSNFQNCMRVGFTLLLTVFITVQAKTHMPTTKAQDYLRKFGYLAEGSRFSDALTDESKFSEALQDLQKLAGLNVTGELGEATMNVMALPRCGVADKTEKMNKNRFKRYVFHRSHRHWHINNNKVTYKISQYGKTLTKAAIDTEIARAFSLWSKYIDLTFIQKKSGQADFDIKFTKGNHGNHELFDGPGGILAHAYYFTSTHFDDDENWTTNSSRGVNLFQAAVHEFGHMLGLQHSNVNSSVMAPFYYGYQRNFHLYRDDILGIQALFGKKTSTTPHLCDDNKINTVFISRSGTTVIFKGDQYYLIKENGIVNSYPRPIAGRWKELPRNIDAAFKNRKHGITYFFKHDKVWCYFRKTLQMGFPRLISEMFHGAPNDVDAVLHYEDFYLFFKGDTCWVSPENPPKSPKSPIHSFNITTLGLPISLDVVFRDTKGDIYAFQNNNGFRLSSTNLAVQSKFKVNEEMFKCKSAKP